MEETRTDGDTFRILVATDNHLGFAEKDPIRGQDSFVTFEEILQHAKERKVDFILLGGDLFHDNKPSITSIHTCMKLLRKYCFGDDPVKFEVLSDQSKNFEHSSFPVVNYEDPNLNVSIPVFSIHGNHDDPAGVQQLASLDILSVAGLVNYFGKCLDLEDVRILPILLQKGITKLALYGLGSIREERLHRLFDKQKVKFIRPNEFRDDWFNIFVIHQNRTAHTATKYVPEQFLDGFLDLVIWGHEHECKIVPQTSTQGFFVSQPGSSVATSMSNGESGKKNCGLLEVSEKEMRMTPIELETVRQFFLEDIILAETSLKLDGPDVGIKVMQYVCAKIEDLLETAEREHSGNPKQPKEPLIRIRVEYTNSNETFIPNLLYPKFAKRVANAKDMILFRRKREEVKKEEGENGLNDAARKIALMDVGQFSALDLVKEYFSQAEEGGRMTLLTDHGLGTAVTEFVNREEKEAIKELITFQLEKTRTYLKTRDLTDDTIEEEIERFRETLVKDGVYDEEMEHVIQEARKKSALSADNGSDEEQQNVSDMDVSDNEAASTSVPTRGRGRGRARGSPRGRAARAPREPRGSRGRGRGAAGRGIQSTMDDFGSSTTSRDSPLFIAKRPRKSTSSKNAIVYLSDDDL